MSKTVCISNWPLPIGVFQDQCKQTMMNEHSNKQNKIKNPKWWESDKLAIYKHSRMLNWGLPSTISTSG